jgi:hypothetical protein
MFLFVLLFSYQVGHLSSRYQQIGFTVFEHFLFINEIVLLFTSFVCLFFFSKKHAFSPSAIRKYESRPSTKSLIHYTENEQPNFDEHQKKKKGGRRTLKEKKLKKNIEK